MDTLSREDLNTLLETHGEWCISIYMPTVRAGQETQQNSIRFKNMLRAAEERLQKVGLRSPDAASLLSSAETLVNNADFWRHQSDGLALFIDPQGNMSRYSVPINFSELVIVTRRFHLKPLLRLLSGDGRFYVLALSQGDLRLLEGTRHSVSEVDLADVPTSLAEALSGEVVERQLQWRGLGRGGQGGRVHTEGGMYHGHGPGDEEKQRIMRYFQMVDRGLRDLLKGRETPLVLAGVDYLLPMYAEANSYAYLLGEGITGNPETLSAKELHRRAWELVEPVFRQGEADARQRFEQEKGRADGLASADLKAVLQAAHQGRVAALFVAAGKRIWGVYRQGSGNVHVHPEMQADDQDLLDLAAVMTHANGGAVYVVEEGAVPGGGELAAVYRF
ncbi:MAG: hypothetical protein GX613_07125 [Chloroflexi bacterium]|nr:hypothetical protein [Chloroflexota bacterium]